MRKLRMAAASKGNSWAEKMSKLNFAPVREKEKQRKSPPSSHKRAPDPKDREAERAESVQRSLS